MSRPVCAAFAGVSLDGFIARPDGALDWLKPYEGADNGFRDFFATVDAVVIGKATYETVLGFGGWAYGEKRVYVLSRHPAEPLHGETFVAGRPAAIAERLAADGVRRAYVDGGSVVSQFLDAALLDELTVTLVPVVLGEGIRLFQPPLPERGFRLVSVRSFPNGLAQLRYARPGHGWGQAAPGG